MKIAVKSWKMEIEDKVKKLGGTYAVMAGKEEIASSSFNIGYGATVITLPAQLMEEAEALDEKIRQAITDHFEAGE